ncbi:MAG: hypothetical protein WC130_04455 [Kiritimatiellia bacterium]
MKTCTIKSVYEALVRKRGLNPATANLSATDKALIADYINGRMPEGYERTWWSDLMRAEQREYRDTYDAAGNYITGDEVYHVAADGGEHYYISLQDANVGHDPDTATTWWAEVGDTFLRTLSFQQQGKTEIGAVDLQNCVFDVDPRINRFAGRIENVIFYEDGILVSADEAPARPWIWFRPPVPEFSLTDWNAATAYAIGDLCYYASSGESYKALQVSTDKNPYEQTEYWAPVEFPAFLKNFIVWAAHAEYLLDPVERDKAEGRAQVELDGLEDAEDQKGVQRKIVFGR